MKTTKFLLLFHFPKNPPVARSPEETQAMYGQWMAEGVVTDGPDAESKDVIGSFTLLATDSLESAARIAQESPFLSSTGGRIESSPVRWMPPARSSLFNALSVHRSPPVSRA